MSSSLTVVCSHIEHVFTLHLVVQSSAFGKHDLRIPSCTVKQNDLEWELGSPFVHRVSAYFAYRQISVSAFFLDAYGYTVPVAQLRQRDRATHAGMLQYSNLIKNAKLTAIILHQWVGEWFPLFIIDNYTVFASFYVEGTAYGNVSSRRF